MCVYEESGIFVEREQGVFRMRAAGFCRDRNRYVYRESSRYSVRDQKLFKKYQWICTNERADVNRKCDGCAQNKQ